LFRSELVTTSGSEATNVCLCRIVGVGTVYAISETREIYQDVTLKSFSDKYRKVSVRIRRRKLTTDVMCFVQIREERWNFIPNIHASYPYFFFLSKSKISLRPNSECSCFFNIRREKYHAYTCVAFVAQLHTHTYTSHVTYEGPS